MTSPDTTSATGAVRGNIVIGAVSVAVGAVVIPYGAGMPYIREGIPGPGLFPMMIGGLLILFGVLLAITSLLAARRERGHLAQLTAAHASSSAGTTPSHASTADEVAAAGTATPADAAIDAPAASGDTTSAVHANEDALSLSGAAVPLGADDQPVDALETVAVMDTDIGSDGARRWINGAILMGGIVFYVLFAEIIGFPLTMTLLITAIVWSLRAKWWVALATGVITSLALWGMFERGLMVQLPDGIIPGF